MDGSIHGSSVSARTAAPRAGRLTRALARTSDAPLRRGNRLSLLRNGPNTFDDWLEAISRAEHWIHLVTTSFGLTGWANASPKPSPRRRPPAYAFGCSTTDSAAWTFHALSGDGCGALAWKFGLSTRRP